MSNITLDVPEADTMSQLLQWSRGFPDFPKNLTLPQRGPDYVPEFRATSFVIYCITALVVTLVIVTGRLTIRIRQRKFGLDDWLIIPALVCSLIFLGLYVILPLQWGVGKHVYDLTLQQLKMAEKFKFIEIMIYDGAVYFTKMSITAFLFRFVEPGENMMRMTLIMTSLLYSVLVLASVVVYAFACVPIHASWDVTARLSPETHCLDIDALLIALGVLYSLGDFWLLFLPMKTIWSLNLPRGAKIGLILVMSLGLIACAGSVWKVVYIRGLYLTWDPTWNSIPTLWGSAVEVSIGIICASIPAYSTLLFATVPRKWKTLVDQTLERSRKKVSEFSLLNTGTGAGRRPTRFLLHRGQIIPKPAHQISTLNLTKWDFGFGSKADSVLGSGVDSGIGTSMSSYVDLEKLHQDIEKPARAHNGRSPLWMSSTNSLHHSRSLSQLSYHRSISQISRDGADSRQAYHPTDSRLMSQRSESALSQRSYLTPPQSNSRLSHSRSASQLSYQRAGSQMSHSQYSQSQYSHRSPSRMSRRSESADSAHRKALRSQSAPRTPSAQSDSARSHSQPPTRSNSNRSVGRSASQRKFYLKPPIESPSPSPGLPSSASTAAAVAALIPPVKSPNLNPFSDPSTYSPSPPKQEVEKKPPRPPTNDFGVIQIGMAV